VRYDVKGIFLVPESLEFAPLASVWSRDSAGSSNGRELKMEDVMLGVSWLMQLWSVAIVLYPVL